MVVSWLFPDLLAMDRVNIWLLRRVEGKTPTFPLAYNAEVVGNANGDQDGPYACCQTYTIRTLNEAARCVNLQRMKSG